MFSNTFFGSNMAEHSFVAYLQTDSTISPLVCRLGERGLREEEERIAYSSLWLQTLVITWHMQLNQVNCRGSSVWDDSSEAFPLSGYGPG